MKTDFNKFNKQGFGSLNNSTNSIQKTSHPKAKQINFAADNQPSLFDTFNVPKQDSFQKTAVAEAVPAAPVQASAPAAAPVNYNYQPQQPQEQSSGFGLKDGLLSIGVLAGIGLGAYAIRNKEGVKNATKALSETDVTKIAQNEIENLTNTLTTQVKNLETTVTGIRTAVDGVKASVVGITNHSANLNVSVSSAYRTSKLNIGDQAVNLLDTRLPIPDEAMKQLQEAAPKRIKGLMQLPELNENSTIQLLSSESKYALKAGGLGDVPPEILENFKNKGELWQPIYLGKQNFAGGDTTVSYELVKNTDKKIDCDYFYRKISTKITNKDNNGELLEKPTEATQINWEKKLKKVYESQIDTNNGKQKLRDNVQILTGIEERPLNGEIVKVRCNYIHSEEGKFGVTVRKDLPTLAEKYKDKEHLVGCTTQDMYVHQEESTESEKFATFCKYKYEVDLKLKENHVKYEQLSQIKDDKGNVIVNGLENYKAPTVLNSDGTIYTLKAPDAILANDWHAGPIAALCRYLTPLKNHFNEISSTTANHMTDVPIFTLVHNAEYQGASYESTEPILNTMFGKFAHSVVKSGAYTVNGMPGELLNTLAVGNQVNSMHMGLALSDKVFPVSENYAFELASPDFPGAGFGGQLKPLFAARFDKTLKNPTLIGITNGNDKAGHMLTANKIETFKKAFGKHCDGMIPLTENNFAEAKPKARAALLSMINEHLNIVNKGNKSGLISNSSTFGNPDISKITSSTNIVYSGGRLVGQKGLDIEAQSVKDILKDWDKTYPGKDKPFFIILGSGQPEESKICIDLAKEHKDNVLFVQAHHANAYNLIMAGADSFMMPSWHEPCGLTQGQAMAVGTVPIANRIGGLVDTIVDGVEGYLTERTYTKSVENSLEKNVIEFNKTCHRAFSDFNNDREKFNQIAINGLKKDLSWNQGPIQKYEKEINFKNSEQPKVDTSQPVVNPDSAAKGQPPKKSSGAKNAKKVTTPKN